MSYLLLLIYLPLCCWLLTKSRFVAAAGIPGKMLITLFLLKVLAGAFNGWLSFSMMPDLTDTEIFHAESLKEYHLLFNNPKEYFTNIFTSGYKEGYAGLFSTGNSYWNDLRDNVIIKLLSFFNIFSFGNYYINVVFLNFFTFFGHVALYKIFSSLYRGQNKICIVTCFLLPSLLYFSSSVHKEGLVFTAIVFSVYALNRLLQDGITFKRLAIILIGCLFVFLQRNFVLIAMLPALFAWVMAAILPYKPVISFVVLYAIMGLLFFSMGSLYPSLNFPEKIVRKQKAFMDLERANSYVQTDTLQPTAKSFIQSLPQALNHSLLRPYVFQKNNSFFLIPLAFEALLYVLVFIIFIFFNKQGTFKAIQPITLFFVFFAISLFLVIGYTIPIVGAIVRYRSIYYPFVLTPVLCNIDAQRLLNFIRIRK